MSQSEEVDYIKQQAMQNQQGPGAYRQYARQYAEFGGVPFASLPIGGISTGSDPSATDSVSPPLDICEYIVLGFGPYGGSPECVFVKDAADMQRVVERIRKEGQRKEISVFKRMLRMKAKTDWETVNVDA